MIGIVGLLFALKPQPPVRQVEEAVWHVEVELAQLQSYTPSIILFGQIESPHHATMRSALEADIKQVYVKAGSHVKAQAVMVELEQDEAKLLVQSVRAQVASLYAQIAQADTRHESDKVSLQQQKNLVEILQREVERRAELLKQQVGSELEYDRALESLTREKLALVNRQLQVDNFQNELRQLEAQLNEAQAQLADAEIELTDTRILAPFDGIVTEVLVARGNRVTTGAALVELFNINDVEVRALIPTKYLKQIYQAMAAKQLLSGHGSIDGQMVTLHLRRLAGEIASGRGGRDAIFTINAAPERYALGRVIEFMLKLPTVDNVYAVPEQAVYDNQHVYVARNQRMVKIPVTLHGEINSQQGEKRVLIRGAIHANELIIVTKLPFAVSGLKVKTKQAN